ncbi:MAG: transposase [bacterium]|nr:transposase [bacterium]
MAARTKTKVSPKYKTKYRVKNWPACDIALRERGDITVWFDEEAIYSWNALPSGRQGGPRKYSDLAIATSLTLRTVFHLPLRQTEGFVASLIGSLGLRLKTPDHTTLSRRSRDVEIPRLMYEALAASSVANIKIVIPPMKTATVERQWRKESVAHQQARAENGMYRYKRIIGDRLQAQHRESQKTEALIAVNVMNRMTALGKPESAKIVA